MTGKYYNGQQTKNRTLQIQIRLYRKYKNIIWTFCMCFRTGVGQTQVNSQIDFLEHILTVR